jgi:hypothetical protein
MCAPQVVYVLHEFNHNVILSVLHECVCACNLLAQGVAGIFLTTVGGRATAMAIGEDTSAEVIGDAGCSEVAEDAVLPAAMEGAEAAKELLSEGDPEKEQEIHSSI